MEIIKLILGNLGTNCYVVIDEQTRKSAVIDPADYGKELKYVLENNNISSVDFILLTHGHYDHIWGVKDLKNDYPDAKIAIHSLDEECLRDEQKSLKDTSVYALQPKLNLNADVILEESDVIKLGSLELEVIHTPGHTPGSICFVCSDVIFSGDTLFCKTVGRTDFLGGNMDDMLKSLKKLGSLKGDYKVLPGHSIETSLEMERHHNRYMRKIAWS